MTEKEFGKGGHRDKIDTRDKKWNKIAAAKASAPFDWNMGYDIEKVLQQALSTPAFRLPVKNQGGSGSCGGQAWASLMSIIETVDDITFEERSAKYIYAQTFVPGGGSYGRDNCNVCVKQGVAQEQVLPSYEAGAPPSESFMQRSSDITPEARSDAYKAKALVYAGVRPSIDEVAQAIRDNYGVVLGVSGSDNGTWLTTFPQPPKPTDELWGHWLYAGQAGMVNGKKAIRVLNSWGKSVGEQGWQWLTEEYFNSGMIWNSWTLVYDTTPHPTFLHHRFDYDLYLGVNFLGNLYRNEVIALQTALMLEGTFPKELYVPEQLGYFGQKTLAAVKAFQIKKGITPISGYVGPKTKFALNQIYSN